METFLIHLGGPSSEAREADVVFVHGLGGDATNTWRVGPGPRGLHRILGSDTHLTWGDWLADEHRGVRILSAGYDASPSKWLGSPMALSDRATNVLATLDGYAVGARPLCFVAHSLGGLLVKQLLRHASDLAPKEYGYICKATRGVVFLSTPHSGAEVADTLRAYFGFFARTTIAINELEAHHARLRELTQWYRNNAQHLGIQSKVFCETQTTRGVMVVNQTSADPGLPNVTPVPIDADHLTICKPASKDTTVYRQTSKFIKAALLAETPRTLGYTAANPPVAYSTDYPGNSSKFQIYMPGAKGVNVGDYAQVHQTINQTVDPPMSDAPCDLENEIARLRRDLDRLYEKRSVYAAGTEPAALRDEIQHREDAMARLSSPRPNKEP